MGARLIYNILYTVYRLLDFAILAYCILSWIVRPGGRLYEIYRKLAYYLEPLFVPARKFQYWAMNKLRINLPLDLSPWITMIFLELIFSILIRIIFGIFL